VAGQVVQQVVQMMTTYGTPSDGNVLAIGFRKARPCPSLAGMHVVRGHASARQWRLTRPNLSLIAKPNCSLPKLVLYTPAVCLDRCFRCVGGHGIVCDPCRLVLRRPWGSEMCLSVCRPLSGIAGRLSFLRDGHASAPALVSGRRVRACLTGAAAATICCDAWCSGGRLADRQSRPRPTIPTPRRAV
jgi:hypothetical protein